MEEKKLTAENSGIHTPEGNALPHLPHLIKKTAGRLRSCGSAKEAAQALEQIVCDYGAEAGWANCRVHLDADANPTKAADAEARALHVNGLRLVAQPFPGCQITVDVAERDEALPCELESLEAVAALFAQAVWSTHERQRGLERENELLHALNAARADARRIGSMARVGVWKACLEDDQLHWSPEMYDIFDAPRDAELNSAFFLSRVHPQDRDWLQATVLNCIETNEPIDVEYRTVPINGEPRLIQARAEMARIDDAVMMMGIARDVTEQRKAEKALKLSEEHYRLLAESGPDATSLHELDGTATFVSPAIRDVMGWDPSELVGQTALAFVHPDDLDRVQEKLKQPEGDDNVVEYRGLCRDGSYLWLESTISVLDTRAGKQLVSSTRDVSGRVQKEENSRIKQHRTQRALDASGCAVFDWDLENDVGYVSNRWHELTGYAEAALGVGAWRALLHPDDVQQAAMGPVFNRGDCGDRFSFEYRLRTRTRGWRWMRTRGEVTSRNAEGRAIRAIGVTSDVTDQVEAQQRLRRREAILNAIAFASEQFLRKRDWQEEILLVLERLGKAAEVSRVYLFENHAREDGAVLMSQRHEWAAEDASAQIDNPALQNMPYIEAGFGRWLHAFSRGDLIYGQIRHFPRTEGDLLAEQNIQAIAAVPIRAGSHCWGFIGFDDCRQPREWAQSDLDLLKAAANIIGAAVYRYEKEQALEESERRYRTLFDESPISLWEEDFSAALKRVRGIERAGVGNLRNWLHRNPDEVRRLQKATRITDLNQTAAQSYGAATKEELKVGLDQILCEQTNEAFIDSLCAMVKGDLSWQGASVAMTLHGEKRWVKVCWSVAPGHEEDFGSVIVSVLDTTDQHRALEALQHSEERHRQMVATAMEGVWVLDGNARTSFVNHRMADLFGMPEEAFAESSFEDILPQDDRQWAKSIFARCCGGEQLQFEYLLRRRDGQHIWMIVSAAPLRSDSGEVLGMVCMFTDISERKQMERVLQQERDFVRTIFDNAEAVIIVSDEEGRLVRFNRATEKLLRKDPRELIGQYVWDVFHLPTEDDRGKQLFKNVRDGRIPLSYELVIRDAGGTDRLFNFNASVLRDLNGIVKHVIGIGLDATAQNQAEQELKASEERYRSIVETAQEGILTFDAGATITYANRQMGQMLGVAPAQLEGKSLFNFVAKKMHSRLWKEIERRKEGKSSVHDACFVHKSGARVWAIESSSPLFDSQGNFIGALSMVTDITARKKAEEEAKLRQQQLVQADKLASLGTLVSGVAHEINNPNQFVLSNLVLLEEAWESVLPLLDDYLEENGDFLVAGLSYAELRGQSGDIFKDTRHGSERIQRIVTELRDYVRQSSSDQKEWLDLNAVARAATMLTNNWIHRSTDHFEFRPAGSVPLLRGNPQRLEQVVINLLVNACQALPDRSKGIVVETSWDRSTRRVLLRVRDEGLGMDEATLKRLTDPFFTTKRDAGGIGLGLAISAQIINEHNGALTFESAPGQGAAATVSLPIGDAHEAMETFDEPSDAAEGASRQDGAE